jgi:hypothetical protein
MVQAASPVIVFLFAPTLAFRLSSISRRIVYSFVADPEREREAPWASFP